MAPYRNPAAMMAAKNWNQNVKNMTNVNPISRTLARDLTGAEDLMRDFFVEIGFSQRGRCSTGVLHPGDLGFPQL